MIWILIIFYAVALGHNIAAKEQNTAFADKKSRTGRAAGAGENDREVCYQGALSSGQCMSVRAARIST